MREISYVFVRARAHARALMTRKSCEGGMRNAILKNYLKAAKYEIQKKPQLVAQYCFVASFGRCFPFFTLRDQLVAQQFVAKSRARVYFEQQILALLLVFHKNHNLSRNSVSLHLIASKLTEYFSFLLMKSVLCDLYFYNTFVFCYF